MRGLKTPPESPACATVPGETDGLARQGADRTYKERGEVMEIGIRCGI